MNEDKKYYTIAENFKDFEAFWSKKEKLWGGKKKINKILQSYASKQEKQSMTRKHFKMIAKVVNAIDNKDAREQVALNFANEIQEFNPRFDMQRFIEACVKEGE